LVLVLFGFYIASCRFKRGLMGMTRRCSIRTLPAGHRGGGRGGRGVVIILAGVVQQVIQLVVSSRPRRTEGHRGSWNGARGMGDGFPAAGLEFRRAAARSRMSTPAGHESSASARNKPARRENAYRAKRGPKKNKRRLHHRVVCSRYRLWLIWHIWWRAGVGAIGLF